MSLDKPRTVFICSCERSMPGFGDSVRRGCKDAQVQSGDQLCGAEIDRIRNRLSEGGAITIACTQQAPLFREVAEEIGFAGDLDFMNIREAAGWSAEAASAGPKAAALVAMVAEPTSPPALVTLRSNGVVLVYGRDQAAMEVACQLAGDLDVTVLLTRPEEVTPNRVWDFPVVRGRIRNAQGHLGAFELIVDDFALPVPSSRDRLRFGAARDGAISKADIVIDLSGGVPLFPAHDLRAGYLKADSADRAAVTAVIAKAAGLVGEFDKPRYIDFSADLCAHSRSRIIGCTRCLDLCPTGAIASAGDHVIVDAEICAGCGNCAAACPTGAAAYAVPDAQTLLRRLRSLLVTYREAGGRDPVVLFHDGYHGEPLIDALARFGPGLPANVLPVAVNEITQLGIEAWIAPVAWGAAAVMALASAKPKHELAGLARNVTIANLLARSLGYGSELCGLIETDNPDMLRLALDRVQPGSSTPTPATFLPLGDKRSLLRNSMIELHRAAPTPVERVVLPAAAPFGGLDINVEGCTLCLSCVSACPTGALSDSEQQPALYFSESACVQCGLCAATCPEKVIRLAPRIDFPAWSAPRRVVKEEQPYECIRCGNPFGTRSTIERIVAKLEGRHWMFSGENARRLELVRMCDNCRVDAAMSEDLDPYAGPGRPAPRTTEDYLRDRNSETKRV
ncbi:4Fe-4S dicluster domain-containing protein [Mesorhizobium sp. M7A.F.Ca.CA.001.12.2.1]|uniref:4Fe-4S binding protein n=1 Tax=unclassified Mesorhizobium TaxID=325217 RepID=UPI000FCAF24F|nr:MULTISPECIES: 4Fe-4S binding protein [unclassified Mesorhizobium]RUY99631.1 4Fe-4S dicluster domain-containing protein [Mesorhizobium sp. M7A.F.Ca.CA.001.12.2.1]RUZ39386.1 4Fe-4S dicluster domain-containing protein [Mesorhizobium sp. M7A.F.Ca.US.003.02.1.1]RUZ80977.1 4Fe-4S dicluster domain-containing protein [Mesorhizobium sp. M7A.F.Ca.US.003.02.2.1]